MREREERKGDIGRTHRERNGKKNGKERETLDPERERKRERNKQKNGREKSTVNWHQIMKISKNKREGRKGDSRHRERDRERGIR